MTDDGIARAIYFIGGLGLLSWALSSGWVTFVQIYVGGFCLCAALRKAEEKQ
jgi:hypothetical protein